MSVLNRSSLLTNAPQLIRELNAQYTQLQRITGKLRKRDASLFEMCSQAIETEERDHAKIYAAELAQVRTMLNAVEQSELAIEFIILRLENFLELHTLMVDLKPTIKVIQNLSRDVARVMPDMTLMTEQLNSLVTDVLTETTLDISQLPATIRAKNVESEEIMNEVTAHIEERLQKAFPEPPSFNVAQKEAIQSPEKRKAVPLTAG